MFGLLLAYLGPFRMGNGQVAMFCHIQNTIYRRLGAYSWTEQGMRAVQGWGDGSYQSDMARPFSYSGLPRSLPCIASIHRSFGPSFLPVAPSYVEFHTKKDDLARML